MSRREMQNYIHQQGQFTFLDGVKNEGMVVSRYNIAEARIEYYFIPLENLLAYRSARSHFEPDAHKKLGRRVDLNSILNARMIN